MKTLTDLEYLKLNKFGKFWHNFVRFFARIPRGIARGFKKLGLKLKAFFVGIWNSLKDIGVTFVRGDWKTKISYFVMGFGNIARGQILRGLVFLALEAAFIVYMIFVGAPNLALIGTLGNIQSGDKDVCQFVPGIGDVCQKEHFYGDNSFQILLFGVLSLFFIIALIYTWRLNVKQNKIAEEILATGKPLKSGKQDVQSLVDDQFHKTLLALPIVGIITFTVLPTFFMILIAFTNYSGPNNMPPDKLFTWVGFRNFGQLFSWGDSSGQYFSAALGSILVWTLIWAFFATFTNYFLGMLVALAINKKRN